MSTPRNRWWGYVRNMIRDYPVLKQTWEQIQDPSKSPARIMVSVKNGRYAEAVAVRRMNNEDRKVFEAVRKAIETTGGDPAGDEKLKLIRYMYWSPRNMPAKSAALHLHISEITAKRWHGEFVRLVARYYGFEDDTPEPNICFIISS